MSAQDRNTGFEIAVTGMAGVFPGARDTDALWRNLRAGRECIATLGDEELSAAGVPPEVRASPRYVRARGVLEGIDRFDAALFDMSGREAALVDPQQRMMLECAWQALEHAGYDPTRAAGGRVGVFAGAGMPGYLLRIAADPAAALSLSPLELRLANDKDFLATRVAYKLGLSGPAVSVQTACSTSLVAVHLACQSLLGGDCDMALAGGVTVQVPQTAGYLWQEGGIASPDGHCRAFDAAARGTVAGSGCGLVVLRRLEDALADGDTIHALILGSAINNDGARKVGYTAPGVEGQAAVIRAAQALAGVAPESIGYVEAHGTGTELGDPIEVAALADAFGTERRGYCALGSVKTNLGHLDAAAGVTGLIKAILCLEHGEIPATLHFERPNPGIDFDRTPFFVNAALRPWERGGAPRRAGVSSFGMGGTNAHVVLEEAPAPVPAAPGAEWQILPLSARTPAALDAAAERLAAHLEAHPALELADAAFTLREGRRAFPHRRAVLARRGEDAAALLRGADPERVAAGVAPSGRAQAVFLFPGQGAQRPGMARGLYRTEPAFRDEVDRCAALLRPALGMDLRDALFAAEGDEAAARLRETWLTQPALFVVEHALARAWLARGVEPAAMLGHSVGEYVAATLAGVFSLEEALALVAERGRRMFALPPGAMLAIPLPEAEARGWIQGAGLDLAAVNAPDACVASGPEDAVEGLRARLAAEGVEAKRLTTSHAFHSAMMDPALDGFRERVAAAAPRPPALPFVSCVTGTWITPAQAADPDYWARQLRHAVRFADGLATLAAEPGHVLLEVGPGRTLAGLARRHPAWRGRPCVATLPSGGGLPDAARVEHAAGALWAAGVPVRTGAAEERRRRVPLPTYPFERRRYWIDTAAPGTRSGAAAELRLVVEEDERERGPAAGGVEPRTDAERRVAEVWRRLFALDRVSADDDFYALGGDSLLATQLAARLGEAFELRVSPRLVLEHRTVAAMAAELERLGEALLAEVEARVQSLSDDEVRALLAGARAPGELVADA